MIKWVDVKAQIRRAQISRKIHNAATFIKENGEDIVTITLMLGGLVAFASAVHTDNAYKRQRIKLMKAETASKKAYAKKFGA